MLIATPQNIGGNAPSQKRGCRFLDSDSMRHDRFFLKFPKNSPQRKGILIPQMSIPQSLKVKRFR